MMIHSVHLLPPLSPCARMQACSSIQRLHVFPACASAAQNDLHELWSLLNLLLPDVFDNSRVFHEWFASPFQRDGGAGGEGEGERTTGWRRRRRSSSSTGFIRSWSPSCCGAASRTSRGACHPRCARHTLDQVSFSLSLALVVPWVYRHVDFLLKAQQRPCACTSRRRPRE